MNNLDDLLNIREASEIAGVSEPTIRKYLGLTKPPRPSRLPNARKITRPGEQVETWAIPLSDLHNAGLMKKRSPKPAQGVIDGVYELDGDGEIVVYPTSKDIAKLRDEIEQLKIQLAVSEQLRELEQELNASLSANLADLRLFLGRSIETSEAQETRRKLWGFRKN
jgi:DNA-binding transcriptional MerR regulator